MESRREQAIQYFKKGYNCSQSVILAHSDLFDIDREALLKLVQPFGGGMGRLRQVCGAVSAMFMVAGALEAKRKPTPLSRSWQRNLKKRTAVSSADNCWGSRDAIRW